MAVVQSEAALQARQFLLFWHNPLNGPISTEAYVSMSLSFKKARVIVTKSSSRRWCLTFGFRGNSMIWSWILCSLQCIGSLVVKVSLEQWLQ